MYCVLLTIISLFITKERALTNAVHSMEKNYRVFFSTEFTIILFRVKLHQVWFYLFRVYFGSISTKLHHYLFKYIVPAF